MNLCKVDSTEDRKGSKANRSFEGRIDKKSFTKSLLRLRLSVENHRPTKRSYHCCHGSKTLRVVHPIVSKPVAEGAIDQWQRPSPTASRKIAVCNFPQQPCGVRGIFCGAKILLLDRQPIFQNAKSAGRRNPNRLCSESLACSTMKPAIATGRPKMQPSKPLSLAITLSLSSDTEHSNS